MRLWEWNYLSIVSFPNLGEGLGNGIGLQFVFCLLVQTIATGVCDHYHKLSEWEKRKAFFAVLAGDLGVDHDNVTNSAQKLIHLHSQVCLSSDRGSGNEAKLYSPRDQGTHLGMPNLGGEGGLESSV